MAIESTPSGDLISRADAIEGIRKCKFESDMPSDWYKGMEEAQSIIEDTPSAVSRKDTVTLNSPISIQAEMVAVVRCKDCKHYIVEGITTQYGWCHEYKHSVDEDDYCSYGERKK